MVEQEPTTISHICGAHKFAVRSHQFESSQGWLLRSNANLRHSWGAQECGDEDMFIDRAVYTRNRSFRLYLSSKAGKEAVLLPTGESSRALCPAQDRNRTDPWRFQTPTTF